MKTIQKLQNDGKVIEFTFIELHVIQQALQEYNRNAYRLTGNPDHAEAANRVYTEFTDLYCDDDFKEHNGMTTGLQG